MRQFFLPAAILALSASLVGCGQAPATLPSKGMTSSTSATVEAQARQRELVSYAREGLKRAFVQMDRNGDGVLTSVELTNPQVFAKHDLNQDRRISVAELTHSTFATELATSMKQTAAQMLTSLDRNRDRTISPQELQSIGLSNGSQILPDPEPVKRSHFLRADRNQDGFLSQAELEHWFGGLFAEGYGLGARVTG